MDFMNRQVYLVKNRNMRFNWATKYGNLMMYEGSAKNFNSTLSKFCTKDPNTKEILVAMEQHQNSSPTDRLCIEFLSRFVKSKKSQVLWFEFDDALLRMHPDLISSPKISIQGTFGGTPVRVADVNLATTKTVEVFEGSEIILKFLNATNQEAGIFDLSFSVLLEWKAPKWNEKTTRCNLIDELYNDLSFADCIIVTAEQKEVKCHKCVLAVNSHVFRAMFRSGLQESKSKVIRMCDVSEAIVKELVAFLYGQEMNEKKEDEAFDLFWIAHLYNIPPLEALMVKSLLTIPDEDFDMEISMDLYFFAKNVGGFEVLCEKMMNIMRKRPKELALSSTYQDLLQNDPNEAAKLSMMLLERAQL